MSVTGVASTVKVVGLIDVLFDLGVGNIKLLRAKVLGVVEQQVALGEEAVGADVAVWIGRRTSLKVERKPPPQNKNTNQVW